jgi:guanylate kinase
VQRVMERALIRKGILFIIVGPAGSGKSTVCERLVRDFSETLTYSTSATTRPPRPNEKDGRSYHFMSREEFEARREKGDFFEWEENHGNLYGTLRENLIRGIDSGSDLLFQIDIRGALNFKRQFPDNAICVFLLPPSFAELNGRLKARGTVNPTELARRFATARNEYQELLRLHATPGMVDYVVVNQDIEATYNQVRAVVVAERLRYLRMERGSVEQFCEVLI